MAMVTCVRCGRTADGLSEAPVGGQLGERIKQNVCADCWNEWNGQSTIVINHYGLVMADPDDRKRLTAAMKEFLNLPAA